MLGEQHAEPYLRATWAYALDLDPDEDERTVRRMVVALARYGRQSMLQWEEHEVAEIYEWWSSLRELIEDEQALLDD